MVSLFILSRIEAARVMFAGMCRSITCIFLIVCTYSFAIFSMSMFHGSMLFDSTSPMRTSLQVAVLTSSLRSSVRWNPCWFSSVIYTIQIFRYLVFAVEGR